MPIITIQLTLTQMTCPHCSGVFALTQEYMDECRRIGNFRQMWACPYCKQERGYGTGKIQELEQEKAALAKKLADEEAARKSALLEADYFRQDRDKIAAKLRTFKALARHMKARHPEYGPSRQPPEPKRIRASAA